MNMKKSPCFWRAGGFLYFFWCSYSLGYQLHPIRQNCFALCLCAVRRWLRCPNCLWIFLRLQFTGIFYVSRMANSICLLFLDFNFISSIPLLRGTACPPFLKDALPFCPFGTFPHTVGNHPPRRAEPARPQLPAARILQPLSISPIFRQFTQLKLSIHR